MITEFGLVDQGRRIMSLERWHTYTTSDITRLKSNNSPHTSSNLFTSLTHESHSQNEHKPIYIIKEGKMSQATPADSNTGNTGFWKELESWKTPEAKEVGPPVEVGSKAPWMAELRLPDGKPTLVVFLRHCGCPCMCIPDLNSSIPARIHSSALTIVSRRKNLQVPRSPLRRPSSSPLHRHLPLLSRSHRSLAPPGRRYLVRGRGHRRGPRHLRQMGSRHLFDMARREPRHSVVRLQPRDE